MVIWKQYGCIINARWCKMNTAEDHKWRELWLRWRLEIQVSFRWSILPVKILGESYWEDILIQFSAVSKIQCWLPSSSSVYTDYWVLTRLQVSQLHDHKHTHIYFNINQGSYLKNIYIGVHRYAGADLSFFHLSLSLSLDGEEFPAWV